MIRVTSFNGQSSSRPARSLLPRDTVAACARSAAAATFRLPATPPPPETARNADHVVQPSHASRAASGLTTRRPPRWRREPATPLTPALRWALGAAGAIAIAAAARRTRSLTTDGAAAAVVVGTVAVGAGWGWGVLLVAFFVASSALSRIRAAERDRRTAGMVAKGDQRDAVQVAANGGLFALAALGQVLWPHEAWLAVGAGALAAAAADSWATEIGTLARRPPRMLIGLRPVPAGTSGAVSGPGTAAALAGAGFVAAVAWAAGWPPSVAGWAVVGGVAGSLADSLLGATIQARRSCPRCDRPTERIVHDCGEPTRPAGGVSWVDNDVVNMMTTLVGAAVTMALAAAAPSVFR